MISYNDENGTYIKSLGAYCYVGDIKENEDLHFETSYILIGDIFTTKNILCNHSLIVLGKLEGCNIITKEDLVCFSSVKANDIVVSKDFIALKDVKSVNLNISGKMFVSELQTKGNLLVQKETAIFKTAFIEGKADIVGDLMCFEGLSGTGYLNARQVFVKDYCDLELHHSAYICLNENYSSNTTSSKNLNWCNIDLSSLETEIIDTVNIIHKLSISIEKSFDGVEKNLDWEEIKYKLMLMRKISPFLETCYDAFEKIMEISNLTKVVTVEEFIKIMQLKKRTPKVLYNISLVRDVLENFFNIQRKRVSDLKVVSTKREDLIFYLSLLEQNKDVIDKKEYDKLFKIIFMRLRLTRIV